MFLFRNNRWIFALLALSFVTLWVWHQKYHVCCFLTFLGTFYSVHVSLLFIRVDVDFIIYVKLQILAGVAVVPLISVHKTVLCHILEDCSLNWLTDVEGCLRVALISETWGPHDIVDSRLLWCCVVLGECSASIFSTSPLQKKRVLFLDCCLCCQQLFISQCDITSQKTWTSYVKYSSVER
jgi:hypothetical protein